MEQNLPLKLDRETLGKLATAQLVDIIGEQAIAIEKLKMLGAFTPSFQEINEASRFK